MSGATNSRNVRTFSGGAYVAKLMAELSRAAIHARIQQAREEAGLDQSELADLLGTHTRTIQNWESKTPPRPGAKLIVPWDRLGEIARVTGVTRDWLLHGDAFQAPGDVRGEMTEIRALLTEVLRRLPQEPDLPRSETS